MYHVLLTNRYLTSRVIPLIAVAAVAMCVALVIIVVSVMTGFLDMVKASGRTLVGDVIVSYPMTGIPYYERLIDRIASLGEVAAATPVVESLGLLKMPYPAGERKQTETVQVWGIDPVTLGRVTGYDETLYWRPPAGGEIFSEDDFRSALEAELGPDALTTLYERGSALEAADGSDRAIVLGMHVSIGNER
ncbi:MAG: hypothetical protein HKO59_15975, partial [Phycisphaerales bacterium]|nr:hypothetical protein [Phycisphaerales bacterium]